MLEKAGTLLFGLLTHIGSNGCAKEKMIECKACPSLRAAEAGRAPGLSAGESQEAAPRQILRIAILHRTGSAFLLGFQSLSRQFSAITK